MTRVELSVRMTPVVYSEILNIAEARLLRGVWESRKISAVISQRIWIEYSKIVYIVLDGENRVAYVGSTNRTVSERLSEHVKIDKRANWSRAMIVPFKEGILDSELRKYEGMIGRRLRPYDTSKLPSSNS